MGGWGRILSRNALALERVIPSPATSPRTVRRVAKDVIQKALGYYQE